MPADILNLSAYAFVTLDRLPGRRETLHGHALACGVKGTVLLAEEGINLFVAGAEAGVRAWLARLREDPLLAALDVKESWSETPPFRHLRVKLKREIVRMNQPQLQPAAGRAPAIDSATLKRWLDAGRDDSGRELLLLDTRNGFEVDAGAFVGATDWRLQKFSDFPAALAAHRAELDGRSVVAYCTGGIRCEKAALAVSASQMTKRVTQRGHETEYRRAVGVPTDRLAEVLPPARVRLCRAERPTASNSRELLQRFFQSRR